MKKCKPEICYEEITEIEYNIIKGEIEK